MFEWLLGRRNKRPPIQRKTEVEAIAKGASNELFGALDEAFSVRVRPAANRLWNKFVEVMDDPVEQAAAATLTDHFGETYRDFVNELPFFHERMESDLLELLSDWLKTADVIGVGDDFRALITKRVADVRNELFLKSTAYLANKNPT